MGKRRTCYACKAHSVRSKKYISQIDTDMNDNDVENKSLHQEIIGELRMFFQPYFFACWVIKHVFLSLNFLKKNCFQNMYLRSTIRESNSLDPDQSRHEQITVAQLVEH